MMNPVVHFEMTAEDRKRMADFYTKVFGWKIQQLGEEMGVLVTTTDSLGKTKMILKSQRLLDPRGVQTLRKKFAIIT
jgi:predicted enzyme related to lactoylglutathione lyase